MDAEKGSKPAWYCIRTKRYKERWAAQHLQKLCQEVYLPLLRRRRIVRSQGQWFTEPLFPGYLFAYFSLHERFEKVRYTPGVARIIGAVGAVGTEESVPQEVDAEIIVALRQRSPNGYIEIHPKPLVIGEAVEVIAGPFQQLRALFQRELKAGERVAVLLELLSSQVVVELPRDHIQKTL